MTIVENENYTSEKVYYENYVPTFIYDSEDSRKALCPDSLMDIIKNPYYFKALKRFLSIVSIFLKILFDYWYDKQKWTYFKQWIKTGSIDRAESNRRSKRAIWLVNCFLKLGPTFIKIGQALSTRADLLRREYILELSKLQDNVPSFNTKLIIQTIKEELGSVPEELFMSFNYIPLAAASLGQVHRAELRSGEQVVVKIQRPNLIEMFNLDVAILKKVASFCVKFLPFAKNRNWPDIVDEFGKTLFEEIDYILEGKNADKFKINFEDKNEVYIPKVYWEFTSRKILTMEYKPGIKIDNIRMLDHFGIDRGKLSNILIEIYLQQFLSDGLYHADPHPGNLAVDKTTEALIFYDFGMTGRIDQKTKMRMLNTFLNLVNRNTDALLKDLVALKMLDRNSTEIDKVHSLIQWYFDNYYNVPYEEVKFEQITDELADIMYVFPFKLPASFTYIVRALVTLEGLSVKLNPRINFMEIAVPFARKFITKSDIYEFLKNGEGHQIYKFMIDKIYDIFGIDLRRKRRVVNDNYRIDKEDIELIRSQIINGFGVIGMGIILCMFFTILALITILLKKLIFILLLLAIMFISLPLYFGIILGVVLSRPTRPKDLLRKHLEQKNKFEYYE